MRDPYVEDVTLPARGGRKRAIFIELINWLYIIHEGIRGGLSMKRAGISRVVVEVIILVIGVALALLIFSPIGSYIFGALGRISAVSGQTTIAILTVSGMGEANGMIYVKNLGPKDLSGANSTTAWQVFIDNTKLTVSGVGGAVGTNDEVLEVDGVAELTVNLSAYSATSSYTIIVYGPGGTQTEYLYRGG